MEILLRHRFLRRVVTICVVVFFASLSVVAVPITFVLALLVDLVRRDRDATWLRRVALVTTALIVEVLGLLCALVLWIVTGFGLARRSRWAWQLHAQLMGLYTGSLLWLVARNVRAPVEVRGEQLLTPGPVIVAARHTSFFDALIPATFARSRQHKLIPHHVLASGLTLAPCIDIVGNRFPNVFIRRANAGLTSAVDDIGNLGAQLASDSCAVIFPEGTFRTQRRFERAVASIKKRNTDLADRVARLEHTLPPRPTGLYALLAASPAADVVLCINTGLESFNSVAELARLTTAGRPIVIEFFRFPRSSIPEDRDAFEHWLVDRWFDVDHWVARRVVDRPLEDRSDASA